MKIKSLISAGLILTLFAAPAFALPTNGGWTTSGQSQYWVSGNITTTNGDKDKVTASTHSDVSGYITLNTVLHYTLAVGGSDTISEYKYLNMSKDISGTLTAPNAYGSSANGGHGFTSSVYGSWFGGTDASF
ncbi:hypothetical protein [Paenibacillus kobensis]|uniref:hypothetical protein n=1 Tax=Paenibacillus kobensis TaxID=59841 RepID=UPI000FD9EF0D|nr:hypothetical protein [Paenibacillus kobensis]